MYETWATQPADAALTLGLSAMRVATAFLLLPLFTQDLVPALVRNALFLALGMLGLLVQDLQPLRLGPWQWAQAYGLEAMMGAALGFLFGGLMWSFEMAGQLIDNKVGATQAQVQDPMSGHQTSLSGAFLARLASWVFMASGGFMLFAALLLDSYALWPLHGPWQLLPAGRLAFEHEFGRMLRMALLVAAPSLLLLYLVDGVLGLVNRYAQQLNVFSLSMSIKSVVGHLVLLLQMGSLVALLNEELLARPAIVRDLLRTLFG
ncbi:type III secretion system export apparatus subunit SctT [Aquabacterium sp. OR-4]|uniref:type III secretion system export apparatus subunit SctT n=1 Tax=Aquabacterium sp. OR-4 TaxID=2978127 RepID=UPI0028C913BA|nr:type III secretion system export apparatus subunit SctT [Aquabacterium sp. OR-4]MDT7837959.1 type III secretion system export apparatus subunit SctT [Aquabacterium sp. OR-4]